MSLAEQFLMTDPDRNELDGVRSAFNDIAADYLDRIDDLPAVNYDAARDALTVRHRPPLPRPR